MRAGQSIEDFLVVLVGALPFSELNHALWDTYSKESVWIVDEI